MTDLEALSFEPADFSGKVRLFPLPNLVMFPHVMQPLHIFEPRYRAMFEEAVADDRLLAMALLSPGWESDYEGRPPIQRLACLGRVATHQMVEGGRYNLLLLGLRRVRIVRELPATKPFREAEVELWEDLYPQSGAGTRDKLLRAVLHEFERLAPKASEALEQLNQLAPSGIPLGMLTDIVAAALELNLVDKYELLAERNVDVRGKRVLEHLKTAGDEAAARATFPPDFSVN